VGMWTKDVCMRMYMHIPWLQSHACSQQQHERQIVNISGCLLKAGGSTFGLRVLHCHVKDSVTE
jgi:hypothetical protein